MHGATTFAEPEQHGFIYLGLTVEGPQRTPVYRWSRRRRDEADRLVAAAALLEERPDVASVRVFRARLVPPLAGSLRHDFAVLIRTVRMEDIEQVRASDEVSALDGDEILIGENAARFGDTESDTRATFLLNHFMVDGAADPVEAWKGLTDWYASTLRVDNSTALRAVRSSDVPFINYVRIPASPPVFLLNQVLRPSFYRIVRKTLKRNGMRPLPGFYSVIR